MSLRTILKEKDLLERCRRFELSCRTYEPGHDRIARAALRENRERKKNPARSHQSVGARSRKMFSAPRRNSKTSWTISNRRSFPSRRNPLPQNFAAVKEELKTPYERIEKLHAGGNKLRGVPTGFTALDNILSGLQKSELSSSARGRRSAKHRFALDIARQAALAGHKVGFFSLEMSREQIIDRIISAESQVPLWHILTGRIEDDTEFTMIQNGARPALRA